MADRYPCLITIDWHGAFNRLHRDYRDGSWHPYLPILLRPRGSSVCARCSMRIRPCWRKITSILRSLPARGRMFPLARIKLRVSRWHRARRQSKNGVECRHWVEAPVKTENIFIEIGLEMIRGDPPVMRAENPRLQI